MRDFIFVHDVMKWLRETVFIRSRDEIYLHVHEVVPSVFHALLKSADAAKPQIW